MCASVVYFSSSVLNTHAGCQLRISLAQVAEIPLGTRSIAEDFDLVASRAVLAPPEIDHGENALRSHRLRAMCRLKFQVGRLVVEELAETLVSDDPEPAAESSSSSAVSRSISYPCVAM